MGTLSSFACKTQEERDVTREAWNEENEGTKAGVSVCECVHLHVYTYSKCMRLFGHISELLQLAVQAKVSTHTDRRTHMFEPDKA